MRWLNLFLLLPVSLVASSAPKSLGERIETLVEGHIEKRKAVGASVGVAKGNQVLFAGGFGFADRGEEIAAGKETVYRIGSITKQFTAAGILLLEKDRKLQLDDRLDKHVPEFPAEKEITLRHLLNHTSGIKSFTSLPSYPLLMGQAVTHEDILGRFRDLPLEFEPGTRYRYSNSGYYLLGMVIENVSGMKYDEFLRKRIFEPLKMTASGYEKAEKPLPNQAKGYRAWLGGTWPAKAQHMSQPFSAGALISSVEDMIRWQRALVEGELFPKKNFERMTTRGKLNNGKTINYGLGIQVRVRGGKPVFHHGGGISGFRSELYYEPAGDYTIVALANSGQANAGGMALEIAKLLREDGPTAVKDH